MSNKTLNNFSDNSKIKNVKFIEVDWDPPASANSWQIESQTTLYSGMEQIRKDRGTKYILALSQVQKVDDQNHYVMFVDADDFIHEELAKYINNSDKDVLKIQKGFQLGNQNTFRNMGNFCDVCGTCNITKVELLKEEIKFEGISLNSPQQHIVQSTRDYYLKMIIGSHKFSFGYLKKKGYLGGDVPFHAAVYNCSHNEQHSGRPNTIFKHKCTDTMVKEFSIKTLRDG